MKLLVGFFGFLGYALGALTLGALLTAGSLLFQGATGWTF